MPFASRWDAPTPTIAQTKAQRGEIIHPHASPRFANHSSRAAVRESRFASPGSRVPVRESRFASPDSRVPVRESPFASPDSRVPIRESPFARREGLHPSLCCDALSGLLPAAWLRIAHHTSRITHRVARRTSRVSPRASRVSPRASRVVPREGLHPSLCCDALSGLLPAAWLRIAHHTSRITHRVARRASCAARGFTPRFVVTPFQGFCALPKP